MDMTHPDLPGSRASASERAFELVWRHKGWRRYEPPPPDPQPEPTDHQPPAETGGLSHARSRRAKPSTSESEDDR